MAPCGGVFGDEAVKKFRRLLSRKGANREGRRLFLVPRPLAKQSIHIDICILTTSGATGKPERSLEASSDPAICLLHLAVMVAGFL
jgi:hypothetical protein